MNLFQTPGGGGFLRSRFGLRKALLPVSNDLQIMNLNYWILDLDHSWEKLGVSYTVIKVGGVRTFFVVAVGTKNFLKLDSFFALVRL